MPQTLNTGASMPPIGFGTWDVAPDSSAKEAVLEALQAGYRLIDTAQIYENEWGIGEAIRVSGVPRQDIFVTTKLWNTDQGYDRTLVACQRSLEKMGLDYIDLYLIHWPATKKRHDSWRAFEKLLQDGLIRAAGVSNYTVEHLQELQQMSDLVPAVNQVEFHPFIYKEQQAVVHYCADQGIVLEAYSPVSSLRDTHRKAIFAIAERHHKTPQQVVLRWCIQHDTIPLTRSRNPTHIRSNFEVFDFELAGDEVRLLDSMSNGERVTWNPAGMG